MITGPAILASKSAARKQVIVSLFAAIVTFLAYTSVYAFRKPITIATFNGDEYAGIPYQSLLIIAQGIGYMLSKIAGIKFIAELQRHGRWKAIAVLMLISWLALLGFALTPAPYGLVFLLLNGFPLGFLWGIIFSYVEGRRATDMIGAAMAVSFIFAGGFTRTVATYLVMEWSVSEKWMPFTTGLLFCLPLALFIYLLEKIPAPDNADVEERTERTAMKGDARKKFLKFFGVGVLSVTITYVFLTLMRDLRDNFMSNIWYELGYGDDYGIMTRSEVRTSVAVLIVMSLLVIIRKNIVALRVIHLLVIAGLIITALSSVLYLHGSMPGYLWMQLTGLGIYMAYIPFNCIFFERMIAAFRVKGNVGFLMYVADAFGYFVSTIILCAKAWLHISLNWTNLFSHLAVIASAGGLVMTIVSVIYFNTKFKRSFIDE